VHRSQLTQILIDCNESVMNMDKAADFWAQALGLERDPRDEPGDRYVSLGRAGHPRVILQQVSSASAYHLDIEADDVEAEVARLEKLGAVRKYKIQTWWVMRAPTGHDFCVIRPQSDDFPGPQANTWDD
jgi:hypothetical protein